MGIVLAGAGVLALAFSALNLFGFRSVLDGSAKLYETMHRRFVVFCAVGILLAVGGAFCLFFYFKGSNATPAPAKEISVTFVNEVENADVWILPRTEENLKTTLWGTPTLSGSGKGSTEICRVDGGAEYYIVRIIDADEGYYAANDLILLDGYTVRFTADADKYHAALAVIDGNGSMIWEKNGVFIGAIR